MATINKRGRSWYIQYTEKGRQIRRSLGQISASAAEAHREATERRLVSLPSSSGPSFASWAEEYSHWRAKEFPDSYARVKQILETHLIPIFGPTPIGILSRREVEAYKIARLEAGAAPGTVTKELRTLQACINKAVEWEVISRSGIKGVKPPRDLNSRPPRWYTKEELQSIYKVEMEQRKSITDANQLLHSKYRWTWQLLANTGMRRTEALQLKWKDVGKDEIRIVSDSTARTKSGKWRLVPVSDGALEALEELKGGNFVLPDVTRRTVSRAFDRTLERAELDGSLHCLRHTYCSHLVMAGVPLRTVQVLAGHASFTTTEKYAHLAPGHLRESVKGLNL